MKFLKSGEFRTGDDSISCRGEVFEDMEVPVLVCLHEIAPSYMTTKTDMVTFGTVRIESSNQGPQSLAVEKLPEHQRKQLVPAGEMLDVANTAVFLHDSVKFAPDEKGN